MKEKHVFHDPVQADAALARFDELAAEAIAPLTPADREMIYLSIVARVEQALGTFFGRLEETACIHPTETRMNCGVHYEWCRSCGAIRRLSPTTRNPLTAWQLPGPVGKEASHA